MDPTFSSTNYTDSDPVLGPPQQFYWIQLNGSLKLFWQIENGSLPRSSMASDVSKNANILWKNVDSNIIYSLTSGLDNTANIYDISKDVWSFASLSNGVLDPAYEDISSLSTSLLEASSSNSGGVLSFTAGPAFNTSGMNVFNSSEPSHPSWTTVKIQNPFLYGSTTQYVKYGPEGALISVGGLVADPTIVNQTHYRRMDDIQVYDVAAQEWFTIQATGAIPPQRRLACSGLASAPDNSSFQMILYGGQFDVGHRNATYNNYRNNVTFFSDTYILAMPAFHWIRINTTLNSTERLNFIDLPGSRSDHFCTTYQNRQFIAFGGSNYTDSSCHNDVSPLNLLDLTTLQWQTQFPLSNLTYQVPQVVIDIVGGGPDGRAKNASTWQHILGNHTSFFSQTVKEQHNEQPPAVSGADVPEDHRIKLSGPLAGSILGFALIVCILVFFLKKKWILRKLKGLKRHGKEWIKPELSATSAEARANGRHDWQRYEVQGDDPASRAPKELDGSTVHELPTPAAELSSS